MTRIAGRWLRSWRYRYEDGGVWLRFIGAGFADHDIPVERARYLSVRIVARLWRRLPGPRWAVKLRSIHQQYSS